MQKITGALGALRRKLRSIKATGPLSWLRAEVGKRWILPGIDSLQPIESGNSGDLEVRMLLPSSRFLEGLLTIYTFLYFSGASCRVRIHSDGTLSEHHRARLKKLIRGADIVLRDDADSMVQPYLRQRDLRNCLRLRSGHVFGLKVIDMCVLSQARRLVLLDCDVLFYARPEELLGATLSAGHLYQRDYRRAYCVSNETYEQIQGPYPVPQLNPGIMSINMQEISLEIAEAALNAPGFFHPNGAVDTFAELTLWAVLVSQSVNKELPDIYNFCSGPWLGRPFVAGHFAGYGYWPSTYYSQGVPYCLSNLPTKESVARYP